MWGSSYLFIKLAVDDFGTFTLVALRLLVGAILLWIVVRLAHQPLPRERRMYGHLLVMAIINITIPFLLITWAEQSVDSSLAAILTSPVPLFAIVLSSIFLADEPMRVNGVVGLVVGFIGVVIITSPRSDRRRLVAHRRARAARRSVQLRVRRGLRTAQRPRPARRWCRRSSRYVRGDHHGRSWRCCSSTRGRSRPTPRRSSRSCGSGSSGRGSPTCSSSGCSPPGARRGRRWSPTSSRSSGIVLGYLVLAEPVDARVMLGTAFVVGGVGVGQQPVGRRRVFGRVPPIEAV